MRIKLWLLLVIFGLILNGCSWQGFYIKPARPVMITVWTDVDKINPTDKEHPGGRGPDELVVYTPEFGSRTGTNIWGVEAVIKDGVAIKVEGNDSIIPPDGLVISGHGEAKRWILTNIHPGSEVKLQDKQLKVSSGPRVYISKAESILAKAKKGRSVARLKGSYLPPEFDKHFERAQRYLTQAQHYLDKNNLEKAAQRAQAAYDQAFQAYGLIICQPEIKVRCAWYRVKASSTGQLQKVIKRLAQSNFNLIFPETIYEGGTLYPSPAELIPQHPEFVDWDPLRVLIHEAHKQGIEVHAWVHIFFIGFEDSPLVEKYEPLLARNYKGELPSALEPGYHYLCPARPKAREFILQNLKYLIENYDLDGLQLDYIRYPSSEPYDEGYCYCSYCRQQFSNLYQADPVELSPDENPGLWQKWNEFREQQITSFVKEVHKELKAIKPELNLSAAVFAELEHAMNSKFQNWQYWAEKGQVDFLCHMAYSTDTNWVGQITREIYDLLPTNYPFYIGLGAYMGFSPELLVDQIVTARDNRAQGIAIFALNYLDDEALRALSHSVFRQAPAEIF